MEYKLLKLNEPVDNIGSKVPWNGLVVVKNLSGLLVLPAPIKVILTGVSFVVVAAGFALGTIVVDTSVG